MNSGRVLTLYRLTFASLITISSVQTIVSANGTDHGHHALILATAEIAGAAALTWNRTEIFGAGLLLLVFATAQVISAAKGDWSTRFLQYAASTLVIVLLDTRHQAGIQTRSPAG